MSLDDTLRETLERLAREIIDRQAAANVDPCELLTPEQVAQLFKLEPDTISAYCKAGKLPAQKFGHYWRIRRVELIAWLDRFGMPEGSPTPDDEAARILRELRTGTDRH